VTIHYVNVNPVSPSGLALGDLFAKPGEIR
jgi:hypothetical protein